jgi:hypothetical protein
MDILYEQVAFTLSIIAGLSSLITVLISTYQQKQEKESVIKKIKGDKLDQVLETDDINKLGNYLEETLSEVSIYQYSKNPEIERQFDRYLEKIKGYVGTTEEISQEEIPEEPENVEPVVGFQDVFPRLTAEYNSVIDELNNGEPWNALAKLRRNIELKLQNVAEERGLLKSKKIPLRRLINVLNKEEVLSGQAKEKLNYAISVSNKAVHGIDVEFNTASEAIAMAFTALQEFQDQ